MGFLGVFIKTDPLRSLLTIAALFIAGVLEGFGIAMLLPLIASMTGDAAAQDGLIASGVETFFDMTGLPQDFGWMLGAMLAFLLAKAVLSILAMREVGKTAARVTADMRRGLINALLNARWHYYASLPTGRSSAALGVEAERVSLYYLTACIMIADASLVLVYFLLALSMSWQLSLVAILLGSLVMWGLRGIVKITRRAGATQTEALNNLLRQTTQSLLSIKPIKAMGREHHYAALLEKDIDALEAAQSSSYFSKEFLRLAREPVVAVFLAAGLYVSSEMFAFSISAIIVMALVFMRMVMKFMSIQSNFQRMSEHESAFAALDLLNEDLMNHHEHHEGKAAPSLKKDIALEDVGFSYRSDENTPLLKHFYARFPAKTLNVIAGPSGSGKTTVIDLVIGFHRPDEGAVRVDDRDLSEIDVRAWRRQIGYVAQDSGLIHDSVFKNITLGDPDIDEDQVRTALKQAEALSFVDHLPDGLNTNIGERGSTLSGGQQQRLAIARALVRKPLLLILDEPTSALDTGTEKELMTTLQNLSGELTIIIISHSEAVKSYAGHIVEMGGV